MERASGIRRTALAKIAAMSAVSSKEHPAYGDLEQLQRSCSKRPIHQHSTADDVWSSASLDLMDFRELEILLALSGAGPSIAEIESAERLMRQLSPYLFEVNLQIFSPSPFLRSIEPSPWETLTFNLASAVLSIGSNHPSLRQSALDIILDSLDHVLRAVQSVSSRAESGGGEAMTIDQGQYTRLASITVSLLGLINAVTQALFTWTASEKLRIVTLLQQILSQDFLISVETAFSTIRNLHTSNLAASEWKRYARHYAAIGKPLGAMLLQRSYMQLAAAGAASAIVKLEHRSECDLLDFLLIEPEAVKRQPWDSLQDSELLVEALAHIAADQMRELEDGADFVQLGSASQQRLAFAMKASATTALVLCALFRQTYTDVEALSLSLDDTASDPIQMLDPTLAIITLRSVALLAKLNPDEASLPSRTLLRFVVRSTSEGPIVTEAARCLSVILQLFSHDAIITTLYTLGNTLSVESDERVIQGGRTPNGSIKTNLRLSHYLQDGNGSAISLRLNDEDDLIAVCGNVIHTIVGIATSCQDDKITALAQSMLIQKFGKINITVDARIINESARLALIVGSVELRSLLQFYSKICHDGVLAQDTVVVEAVSNARKFLALSVPFGSPLHSIYLLDLLETVVSKGDINADETSNHSEFELAAEEIGYLLSPLALLVSRSNLMQDALWGDDIRSLARDAWFNIVVHGFTGTRIQQSRYASDLNLLATNLPPMTSKASLDLLEGDVELNTTLRRGINFHRTAEHKRALTALLPGCESQIKSLIYPRLVFLRAASLMETARAESGDCSTHLSYFADPTLVDGATGDCMAAICEMATEKYLQKALQSSDPRFSPSNVAKQLAALFIGACHRVQQVQLIAIRCADRIMRATPSSLCQKPSLFALLELLTLMWKSCLEEERDEYHWTSRFTSLRGGTSIELSDDYTLRRKTLNTLHRKAKEWVMRVIDIAPLIVKGLFQTYLSDYRDDDSLEVVSLGRSFALEMGCVVPDTDQQLGAIGRLGEMRIDTASDFISQFTTRQEYKYAGRLLSGKTKCQEDQLHGERSALVAAKTDTVRNLETTLAHLDQAITEHSHVSDSKLRDILQRAAALLGVTGEHHCSIAHLLVGIPFAIFTEKAIELGISLWLSVINENPRMGTRLLVEIAVKWQDTVRKSRGMFDQRLRHLDPFYLKEEFAPSDREVLRRRQKTALKLIGPHLHLLHFLGNHLNANRLGNIHIQRIYQRLVQTTLSKLKHSTGHPLTREVHFRVILFSLTFLRNSSTGLEELTRWRLKDQILSAALSWFHFPPRWSFGGNRLQVKAETQVLADVENALQSVAHIGLSPTLPLRSLEAKQDLLGMLIHNEQTRLHVWLFPLDHSVRHHFATHHARGTPSDNILLTLLRVAWDESVALAIRLNSRFRSAALTLELRNLLLRHPEKATEEPDALPILLGSGLPGDVSAQLKYLLYWAPVDPITAMNYFLPAFKNDSFIVQYAMRALESHSVEVTFFYVPQLVQTLRYDVLGYVERYIIETAKFSQLFAHQIIWNMKANAYKDEESQIPDPIKPQLDKVMESLFSSFSGQDRAFYEREFSFFAEITNISGKLRPYIKRSKAEKKQKIEEELRKIKVDIGVYLPSNPNGIVIGIDRTSGKPLQSHAKAPYLATFRIRKKLGDMAETEDMVEQVHDEEQSNDKQLHDTVEVWQSAIFKVGDDCRQDVLALQIIAAFRGIFNHVGLDVYVYPYRVTATAPGCGVIDVLPNTISRDMLGREAVNGLYDYFVSKYGGEQSVRFQEARTEFVKSMAAYSVISYLLQFKDRHNGNIMIDDAGHILHIDFGFCFDIAPGGVRFERAPFKLTSEMLAVMGEGGHHHHLRPHHRRHHQQQRPLSSSFMPTTTTTTTTTMTTKESQAYRWFEELCIKAFLACRPHHQQLINIVRPMLDSGLPCFKPDSLQSFRDRFVIDKTDGEAADFMRDLIRKSRASLSTKGYDQFQLLTNGIPY